jgi:exonuclease SbcC
MKLLLLGDTHFSGKSPERRKDDYFATQLNKLEQVFSLARKYCVTAIIQTGDFFNSPYTSDYVKAQLIRTIEWNRFNSNLSPICCIFGQHDVFGHTSYTFQRSPLAVLEAANCITMLSEEHITFQEDEDPVPVRIFGASFGQIVPEPISDKLFNVLVVHDMIGDRELYPGQELKGPRKYLRDHSGYDLIVCGDYHYTFDDKWNNKIICNPGCLMRKTISKFDLAHKPGVFICDTTERDLQWIPLKVGEVEEVFDTSREEKCTTDMSEVMSFIESLKVSEQIKATWQTVLQEIMDKREIDQDIRDLLSKLINEALGDKK